MLKLFERLPDSVTVGKKVYKCNFDFRNVLRFLDIMQREDITPDARDYLCCKCVCRPPKNAGEVYSALCAMLFPAAEGKSSNGKRLTSYEQDAGLIRTAFRQEFGIDLFRDKLHWMEFVELLQNLPEGNRYEETVGIRARPMPAPTKYNSKEREWLMKAKQSVALHLNEREQEKKYDVDVGKVFNGLISMMQKGADTDGGK